MTSSDSSSLFLALILVAGATAPLTGCIDHVDTSLRSCPCATGNVCCASGVCAETEDACGSATAALSASVQGEWGGYIENFRPGYEDRIKIAVVVDASGALSGMLTFGVDEAPPPPTDPKQPWPPGPLLPQPAPVTGVPYTASNIAWSSRRLKMSTALYEPWHDWCALQPPFAWTDGSFRRYPEGYYDPNPGDCTITSPGAPDYTLPCETIALSDLVCQCKAGGCTEMSLETVSLDIAFSDRSADGSINFWGSNYTLRLTRKSAARK